MFLLHKYSLSLPHTIATISTHLGYFYEFSKAPVDTQKQTYFQFVNHVLKTLCNAFLFEQITDCVTWTSLFQVVVGVQ